MHEFNNALEQQIPRLRRYARALTRNEARADDLVQETLVRALDKQRLWQPGTNLRAWLFTIMHNLNVNEVRRSVRDDAAVDIETCSGVLAAGADPTGLRQLRELEWALSELPHEQRQPLLLVGLEGMSYEETATVLNIPTGTVRSRISRGRAVLRNLMQIDAEPVDPSTSLASIPVAEAA
jgi:RNA polymerase sigma-70 factor, ECF subfamily